MSVMQVKPLSWFKVGSQIRKFFDPEKLRELAESMMARGQLVPVIARSDGTLIAGERRLRAAQLAGLTQLLVIISEKPLSDSEVRKIMFAENIQRADLTGFEKWQGCVELLALNPGWTQKDLAANVHLSEAMIVRLVSPSRCIKAWQEAATKKLVERGGTAVKVGVKLLEIMMKKK